LKDIQPFISPLIESQFPAFYREEGPVFVQFVKTYYEWLEQSNNVLYHTRRLLEYRDIDQTVEDFIVYFKEQTLKNVQFDLATNKRLLVKNALDLYRSKGTPRSVDLFFKLVYAQPAKIYYPADDVLKLSDNTWKIPTYLEVSSTPYNGDFEGKQIFGLKSGATAFVESYVIKKKINNQVDAEGTEVRVSKNLDIFFITNVQGDFEYGEKIIHSGTTDPRNGPAVIGSLTDLSVLTGASDYVIGDVVTLSSNTGYNGKALVTSIINTTGEVEFRLIDGGWGYTTTPKIIISDKALVINNVSSSTRTSAPFKLFRSLVQPKANIQVQNISGSISANELWYSYSGASKQTGIVKILSSTVNSDANTANLYVSVITGTVNTTVSPTLRNSSNVKYMTITSYTDMTASANLMGFSTNNSLVVDDLSGGINFRQGEVVHQQNTSVGEWANAIVQSIRREAGKIVLDVSNTNGSFIPNLRVFGRSSGANAKLDYLSTTIGIYNTSETSVSAVTINTGGQGYTNGELITFTSEFGFGAAGIVSTNSIGGVTSVTIVNGGSGYFLSPNVSIVDTSFDYTFNANTAVDEELNFINIPNNGFVNSQAIRYSVTTTNTALLGLTDNQIYYARLANSTGIKVSETPAGNVIVLTKGLSENGHSFSSVATEGTGFSGNAVLGSTFDFETDNIFVYTRTSNLVSFNAQSQVNADIDFVEIPQSPFVNGDAIRYTVSPGNTVLTNLSNNAVFYAKLANSSGLSLSYANGLTINLSDGPNENGHFLATYTTGEIALVGEGSLAEVKVSSLDDEETVALNSDFLSGYNIYGYPYLYLKVFGSRVANGGVSISANGGNYNSLVNNQLIFENENTGSGATAIFTNTAQGNIASITILNYGSGYTSSPTVSIGGKSFNPSDIVFDFVNLGNSNPYVNGDILTYGVSAGNTALTNLANAKFYYTVSANSTGIKLANEFDGDSIDLTNGLTQNGHSFALTKRFNSNSSITNETDFISFGEVIKIVDANTQVSSQTNFISIPSNEFVNGQIVTYLVSPGNTALTNLVNNNSYYVIASNSSGIKLSNTKNGSQINLTAGLSEIGHFFSLISNPFSNDEIVRYLVSPGNTALTNLSNSQTYYVVSANSIGVKLSTTANGSAINLTKGVSENGHILVSTTNTISFNSNASVISNFIPITYNELAVEANTRYLTDGSLVKYFVRDGNTAVSGLANGSTYYVVQSNSSGVKLSSTVGGSPIPVVSGTNQTGHVLVPGNGASFSITLDTPATGTTTYGFPAYPVGNLIHGTIRSQLSFEQLTIGTITVLNRTNPGDDYTLDPFITIVEPLVAGYRAYDMIVKIDGESSRFALNENIEVIKKRGFNGSSSNVVSGTIYMNDHDYANDEILVYTTATGSEPIGGLANGESYYVVQTTTGTFRLSLEADGDPIDLVATPTSSVHFVQTGNFTKLGILKTIVDNHTLKIRRATMNKSIDSASKTFIRGESSDYQALVIDVRDDLTFSGLNSVVEANVINANGSVKTLKVIDSGFAYAQGDIMSFQRENDSGATVGLAKGGLARQGYGSGFYQNTKGFLSADKYLQDNDFYQDYSYQVISRIPFERYQNMLKKVLHVAGTKMFPGIEIESEQDASIRIGRSLDVRTTFNPVSNVDIANDFLRLGVLSGKKYFNANTGVNDTTGFITISANKFKNTQEVVYLTDVGNTVIDPLANDSIYFVVHANTTGVILSNTYNGNAIILIKGETESGHSLSLLKRHGFANGDLVNYSVDTGNTVIPGYANNKSYYVAFANTTGFKLAETANGVYANATSSVVNILPTPTLINENGHGIQKTI